MSSSRLHHHYRLGTVVIPKCASFFVKGALLIVTSVLGMWDNNAIIRLQGA